MVQAVSEAAVQLSLNPQVYQALSAIDTANLDAATKHYLERTLLQYRLAGVDKDQATREKIQQLQERITELGLTFGRNVQEQGNTVVVEDAASWTVCRRISWRVTYPMRRVVSR